MRGRSQFLGVVAVLAAVCGWGHAPISPVIRGPLRVEGTRLLDGAGNVVLLRGATLADVDAATAVTLGAMRIRWNFNAVRIPVSGSVWQREGSAYLDRVGAALDRARAAELAVVLVADVEGDAGAFWAALAGRFRDRPEVIFSLTRRPVAFADWTAWQTAMQRLFDAVRGAGARQVVAVPAVSFAGWTVEREIRGSDVLYEASPGVGALPMAVFGELAGRRAIYAGEWGLLTCGGLPGDPRAVSDLVFGALFAFDDRGVSWTAAGFAAGSLLARAGEYEPSVLEPGWRCGEAGMGEAVLTWTTGDPIGFGYLRREAIASAAGGPATAPAPGQLLTLYIEQMGPAGGVAARLDANGALPTELGGATVLFDGVRAPLLFAEQYQLNVQAPVTLTPGRETEIQVFYRGVPSNRVRVEVAAAAPEIFHDPVTRNAIALNEDGSLNGAANPARAGSIVVLFATGTGLTTPVGRSGVPATAPHPVLTQAAGVRVGGLEAEVLFAGEVPGFVGLSQVNARLAAGVRTGTAGVVLRVGGRESQAPVGLAVTGS